MINHKFLVPEFRVAGLEFMDFQSQDFFNEMVALLEPYVSNGKLHDLPDAVHGVIKKYCGFENLNFNLLDYGNLAIDTGYVSPGNILNSKGIEFYFPKSQTNLYRWFTQNKANLLLGSIDFKTGKVGGAYAKMPFEIYINTNLDEFMGEGLETDVLVERLVGFLTHELGHAFSGIFAIHRAVMDSYAITAAVHWMANESYGESKVAIIKDTLKLMEIDEKQVKDLQKIAECDDQEIVITSLAKLAKQRTQMNSQSLGVDMMNSEVLADVYAIRMGCDKRLIEGLRAMEEQYSRGEVFSILGSSVIFGCIAVSMAPIMGVFIGSVIGVSMILSIAAFNARMSSDIYDTPYRRMLNAQQEAIARLKQNKRLSNTDKRKMIADIENNAQHLKAMKNIFEDTGVQRFMTWMFSPGDSRFNALEHYTKILLNNEMSVLNSKIQLLGKED